MDNEYVTRHECDTSCLVKCTFSIIVPAVYGSSLLTVSALISDLNTDTVNWKSTVFVQWIAISGLGATLNESVNWNGRRPSRWTGICSHNVLLLLNVIDYKYDSFH